MGFDPIGALRDQLQAVPEKMADWGYVEMGQHGDHVLVMLPVTGPSTHVACTVCGGLWRFDWSDADLGRTLDAVLADCASQIVGGLAPQESYPVGA